MVGWVSAQTAKLARTAAGFAERNIYGIPLELK